MSVGYPPEAPNPVGEYWQTVEAIRDAFASNAAAAAQVGEAEAGMRVLCGTMEPFAGLGVPPDSGVVRISIALIENDATNGKYYGCQLMFFAPGGQEIRDRREKATYPVDDVPEESLAKHNPAFHRKVRDWMDNASYDPLAALAVEIDDDLLARVDTSLSSHDLFWLSETQTDMRLEATRRQIMSRIVGWLGPLGRAWRRWRSPES